MPEERYYHDPLPGDYSFILLRRLRGGKVETAILGTDIHTGPDRGEVPFRYRVAAILDLNGNGVMEIVVEGSYYEGSAIAVLAVGGLEVKQVLDAACGA